MPGLGALVEVGVELVVLLLRDRVVLVVVALGAADGEAEEGGGGGVHAIEHVLDARSPRRCAPPSPLKVWLRLKPVARRCSRRGVGEQVAGDLLDGELVERQVVVHRRDHPVAPGPHRARGVGLVAVGVGVAGGVEPVERHALAVARRGQQAIHDLLVGVGRLSARKASTSAGVGGRPVRSSVTRRISVRWSASGEGASPSSSSRARMKRSIGFLRPGGVLRLAAAGESWGGMNAQCGWYAAPSSIHRLRVAFCCAVSARCDLGGGICSSGSWR